MINWLYYFYYRCLQVYKVPYQFHSRAASPLQFSLGMNLAAVILVGFRIKGDPGRAMPVLAMLIGCASFIVSLTLITVFLWVTEKTIIRKSEEFEKETPDQRKTHGKIALGYFIGSILLYAACFML